MSQNKKIRRRPYVPPRLIKRDRLSVVVAGGSAR
jgi:hypothetical protein